MGNSGRVKPDRGTMPDATIGSGMQAVRPSSKIHDCHASSVEIEKMFFEKAVQSML
jgi:hypothetical protein